MQSSHHQQPSHPAMPIQQQCACAQQHTTHNKKHTVATIAGSYALNSTASSAHHEQRTPKTMTQASQGALDTVEPTYVSLHVPLLQALRQQCLPDRQAAVHSSCFCTGMRCPTPATCCRCLPLLAPNPKQTPRSSAPTCSCMLQRSTRSSVWAPVAPSWCCSLPSL
jgi:hypothetical protein